MSQPIKNAMRALGLAGGQRAGEAVDQRRSDSPSAESRTRDSAAEAAQQQALPMEEDLQRDDEEPQPQLVVQPG